MEMAGSLAGILQGAGGPTTVAEGLAAGGTAGAGGWVTSVQSPASTALGVLQGKATAASMLNSYASGFAGLTQGVLGFQQSTLEARQVQLASEERGIAIQRDLARKVGDARVAFAASGLDISSAASVEKGLGEDAAFQTGIEKNNAVLKSLAAKNKGLGLLAKGAVDLSGGMAQAANTNTKYQIDLVKRG